jgi:hypothetical protein
MTPQKDVNDTSLDSEVERLLSVQPSAEFQARVRTRVARETIAAPGDAFRGWSGLRALAFVAACIVLAMVVTRWNRQTATPISQARVTPAVRDAQPPSTENAATVALGRLKPAPTLKSDPILRSAPTLTPDPALNAGVIAPVVAVQTPAPYDPFNDVLVSASEQKALRQIETLMAGRELKEEEAPKTAAVRDDMTELVIAPIAIEPIQIATIKGDAE